MLNPHPPKIVVGIWDSEEYCCKYRYAFCLISPQGVSMEDIGFSFLIHSLNRFCFCPDSRLDQSSMSSSSYGSSPSCEPNTLRVRTWHRLEIRTKFNFNDFILDKRHILDCFVPINTDWYFSPPPLGFPNSIWT